MRNRKTHADRLITKFCRAKATVSSSGQEDPSHSEPMAHPPSQKHSQVALETSAGISEHEAKEGKGNLLEGKSKAAGVPK